MDTLRAYLSSLSTAEQAAYAKRCRTSIGYLRKAISKGQRLGATLCISLDRESGRAVRFEDLRPDSDWNYVRSTAEGADACMAGAAVEEGA
ncbi:DNA-binding transcriptional regulator YdaS (Cro superfamily) [Variovorax boronicumulans]|uniref:DNA-binding transcriptional regulator YdaS (Cro superfamily) n=1 Tax=Variovorax boronicumulans TaxID=436515 RepID=A0AAW8CLL5_9BURK|nr:YdaS family helix-turn-helix protein [Variovorax boronicumulans]MDP9891250.1 DNA-binding transcriptional regulator YdaS (Cro superfamily) [Variovorax boronicumulans]MDQ0051318.1 DNA-binding transcriptional regulator YdaS (Cro superfamily) [Variovorax boronicumulans]